MQEGFGRTPVEAALCEVPVISTKETSLPEATMNMVYYYEPPTDENALASRILDVLQNKPTKVQLKKIANKLEVEYNEKKIIEKYINLIKQILKEY